MVIHLILKDEVTRHKDGKDVKEKRTHEWIFEDSHVSHIYLGNDSITFYFNVSYGYNGEMYAETIDVNKKNLDESEFARLRAELANGAGKVYGYY